MAITREQYHRHLPWLALGLAVPLLALLMRVELDSEVAFKGMSFPLPQVCYSQRFFGIACPGCGLTRSIIYLMHGKFAFSYAVHHLGWLVFLVIIAQIPFRLWCLWRGQINIHWSKTAHWLVWGVVAALFALKSLLRWFE